MRKRILSNSLIPYQKTQKFPPLLWQSLSTQQEQRQRRQRDSLNFVPLIGLKKISPLMAKVFYFFHFFLSSLFFSFLFLSFLFFSFLFFPLIFCALGETQRVRIIAHDALRVDVLGLSDVVGTLQPMLYDIIERIGFSRAGGVAGSLYFPPLALILLSYSVPYPTLYFTLAELYRFMALGPKDAHYHLKILMKSDFVVRESVRIESKAHPFYFLPKYRNRSEFKNGFYCL